jgi:hypothetical protein
MNSIDIDVIRTALDWQSPRDATSVAFRGLFNVAV